MSTSPRRPARHRVAFYDDHPLMDTGATRWTRVVATELSRRGWQASVIFPHEGVAVERARAAGLPVAVVTTAPVLRRYGEQLSRLETARAMASLPAYWHRLRSVLHSAADIVHLNDHRSIVLAGPAARLARRHVVWHVHTANTARILNRIGSRLADAVVVPSLPTRDETSGLRSDVVVLPNAVDDRWFSVPAAPATQPTLLATIGRLHPIKGFDVLLRAVAALQERNVDVRLRIIGGEQHGHEGYARDLAALAQQLHIADRVEFAGAVEDAAPLMTDASVYVQPSRFEPGGLAVLEAMASARPVVATAVGGMAETVVDGETGWLVPPDDVDALAAALRAAVTDRERARRRGAAGQDRARYYTVSVLVDRLEALYEQVLAR